MNWKIIHSCLKPPTRYIKQKHIYPKDSLVVRFPHKIRHIISKLFFFPCFFLCVFPLVRSRGKDLQLFGGLSQSQGI